MAPIFYVLPYKSDGHRFSLDMRISSLITLLLSLSS